MNNPPFADKTLLGTCLKLAYWTTLRAPRVAANSTPGPALRSHATFYEALPANVERRAPVAPLVVAPKRAPQPNALQRVLAALDNWFYRQRLASRDAYLSQADNIFDLESRMRELERRPHY